MLGFVGFENGSWAQMISHCKVTRSKKGRCRTFQGHHGITRSSAHTGICNYDIHGFRGRLPHSRLKQFNLIIPGTYVAENKASFLTAVRKGELFLTTSVTL